MFSCIFVILCAYLFGILCFIRWRLVFESVRITAWPGLSCVMSHDVAVCMGDNSALTIHDPLWSLHLDLAVLFGS